MKLDSIQAIHILDAAKHIDYHGIPVNFIHNNYWVALENGKEYPFKHLVRVAFQKNSTNEKELKFQSNDSYRNYVRELGFQVDYYKEDLSFLSKEEMHHYCSVSGKLYRNENAENRRQGDLLKPFVRKIKYWADHCLIEGFQVKGDNKWQWSGHFKPYLWHRFYRSGDSGYVYFVLGFLGSGYLYMELNCQRSQYASGNKEALSKETIDRFDQLLIKSNYEQVKIPIDELEEKDWDSIIEEGQAFVLKYVSLYDRLEKLLSEDRDPIRIVPTKGLIEKSPPSHTKSRIKKGRTYKGRKIDWGKSHNESMKLGDAGERLVILHEQEKLRALKLHHLAVKVHKKLDGEGYDILSYDKNECEIHIEVKTTIGTVEEPFYMSINEVKYSEDNPENYFLYRLYNYDYIENSAIFYILTACELAQTQKNALSYEVVINSTNNPDERNGEK